MNAQNSIREKLHETALRAPSSSGVYLWKNPQGKIIYVGKAKNLKHRLTSYFNRGKDIKTRLLVSSAESIEYITTANEYEAFLLENTLIKKHTPRYNINLKDGKSYPVLRITKEDFPKLFKTRHIMQDGSTYFGPFPDVGALDTFLDALARIYPLRHCRTLKKRESPCMYYHIGWCSAPCCKKISQEAYSQFIGEISMLLEGKDDTAQEKLKSEMKKAAAELNFEKAARLRDGIRALAIMMNQNAVEGFDSEDRDYLAHWREGELVSFTVLRIRDGKLVARDNFRLISLNEDAELLPEFLNAYYIEKSDVPPKIYVSPIDVGEKFLGEVSLRPLARTTEFAVTNSQNVNVNASSRSELDSKPQGLRTATSAGDTPATPPLKMTSCHFQQYMLSQNDETETILLSPQQLEHWFSETLDAQTSITPVTEGIENFSRHSATLNMAFQNAHEDIIRRLRERGDMPALEELKQLLHLPHLPARIEGFDIAHIGGKFPVASLISFYNGNPDRKNYRYFRLKTTDGIIDDFASMREAVSRRYSRLVNEQTDLPDLILIDGGIGQVNAVAGVINALGLDIPIAGLAKRDEEIYRPGISKPINLPKRSDALRLLQRVRDETHRFATTQNQKLRTKENTVSILLELPNVGEKRARALMKEYSTLEILAHSGKAERISEITKLPHEKAEEILESARALAKDREQKKVMASHSLGAAGTTTQKASNAQYVIDLASEALMVAEDEPEYKAIGK